MVWKGSAAAEHGQPAASLRRALVVVAGLLAAIFGASQAFACTLCHSRTAQDVRAAVFGPDFWENAAAMSAVVPALVLAVMLVRRILL